MGATLNWRLSIGSTGGMAGLRGKPFIASFLKTISALSVQSGLVTLPEQKTLP
jgi:hypothetical protein